MGIAEVSDNFSRESTVSNLRNVIETLILFDLIRKYRNDPSELEKTLFNLGCEISRYDPAMYIYFSREHKTLSGMLLTHVDDFLHGSGDEEFHNNVMLPLKERFKFGNEDNEDFLYVGLHVVQTSDEIVVDQDRYVNDLEAPDIECYSQIGDLDTALDEDGQSDFRAVVGRIGWIANSTRPDLSYDYLVLSIIFQRELVAIMIV